MKTRTWPYGTRKEVKIRSATGNLIIGEDGLEAFALIGHGLKGDQLPSVGSFRTIVFTQGGPTGGYWKLEESR